MVDFDRLAEVDIPARTIRAFYNTLDEKPLLNDVSVTEAGEVFVTGSATNAVYLLRNGELILWAQDDERLQFANGIHATLKEVVIAAYHLIRVDRENGNMEVVGDTGLLYDLEGVKPDGDGGFYVSAIGDRLLYHVKASGDTEPMFGGQSYLADFDISEGLFAAPTSPDTIIAFEAP